MKKVKENRINIYIANLCVCCKSFFFFFDMTTQEGEGEIRTIDIRFMRRGPQSDLAKSTKKKWIWFTFENYAQSY
jgi:hypothetical protein